MGLHTPFLSLGVDAWTGKPYHICSKKSLLSFAVIIALVFSMVSERLLFKLMVDRMESYRYFLCQLMTFIYIPPLFCIVGYKSTQDDFIEEEVTEFPKSRFFVMGMLDLIHAMMVFLPGGKTAPAMTVILMQASVPVTATASMIIYGTKFSRSQVVGIAVMIFAIVITLIPALESVVSSEFETREGGWNTIVFLLSAIPAAASMMYKERAIQEQPMDMVYLNAWVSVYQFIGGLMLAPFVFDVDFLHLNQRMSGLECLINGRNEVYSDKCHLGIGILMAYVVFNVAINLLLLALIKLTGVSVTNSTAIIGFVASFMVLEAYEWDPLAFGGAERWVSSPFIVDIIAFIGMLAGKTMYHCEPEPDIEATTTSAEDKEAASLLNEEDDFGFRYT